MGANTLKAMTEIAKLLVDLKVARVRCLKAKSLAGMKYDQMADAVEKLYNYLDRNDIETLESVKQAKATRVHRG